MADARVLISVRVPAELEAVRLLGQELRKACEQAGMSEAAAFEIELAMVEAANNIVIHGYAGREGAEIGMDVRVEHGAMEVALTDTGSPIPAEAIAQTGAVGDDSEHGRGIAIILAFVDSMDYRSSDGFNRLLLRKALAS
ncbi:MAG: ATP-binding protein [Sphingomonadales bacterium]